MQAVQLCHILYIPKNSATSYIIETLFNSIFITEPFMWQNNRLIYLFIINTYFFKDAVVMLPRMNDAFD